MEIYKKIFVLFIVCVCLVQMPIVAQAASSSEGASNFIESITNEIRVLELSALAWYFALALFVGIVLMVALALPPIFGIIAGIFVSIITAIIVLAI